MTEEDLNRECEEIRKRVMELSDDDPLFKYSTREEIIREKQHFAGVRFYSKKPDQYQALVQRIEALEQQVAQIRDLLEQQDKINRAAAVGLPNVFNMFKP